MTGDARAFELFSRTAANRFLGTRLLLHTPERVEVQMQARPEMAQEYGIVQGGFISALADTAAVYLLIPRAMDVGTVHGAGFRAAPSWFLIGPAGSSSPIPLVRDPGVQRGRNRGELHTEPVRDRARSERGRRARPFELRSLPGQSFAGMMQKTVGLVIPVFRSRVGGWTTTSTVWRRSRRGSRSWKPGWRRTKRTTASGASAVR